MPAKKKSAASTSGKKAASSRRTAKTATRATKTTRKTAADGKDAARTAKRTAKRAATKTPAKKASTKASAGKVTTTRQKATRARRGAAADKLAVREDESPWTVKELDAVRDDLHQEVDRLTAELSGIESEILGLMTDGGDGAGDDQADVGTKTFEREHEFSLAQNSRDLLVQSEHALERIENGTYGTCENCGNPIGKMRLQAFPRATLCMACKREQERH